ncbi:metallo-beta-lactamase superfamily hydrolase [Wolbachia endosymbiont of Onchocerca ochengi]|uniref:ribonuclease J n=1 Tax=Wolbachia endosymbiont of Onchocerca ochengi TaxID=100901 RepID=UPI00026DA8D3|nr:ribonuclease J [Wolbachia endosymbiont of Onchocerca ochengi]CCF78026.1 metallo-beta-lactamase superfamily hydrolase [Wolbachia endosymbiont of Onchocerca ochengi]
MNINKNEFLFLSLGGVGRIGMNVSLYHCQGKWIMIDLGIGFADETMPGIELLIADVSFISQRKKDLLGIIITHAHEDHCGAVPYLWKELQCPIYATNFTVNFLKEKLKEFQLKSIVPVKEVNINGSINLGPFTVEFINITHSIPEAHSILISTNVGSAFHTSDWKFDPKPVVGLTSNIVRLKEIGDKGNLLAAICDSTNILSRHDPKSEGEIYNNIYNIIRRSKRLVVVSLFASNVARIETISQAAKVLNRKVVLLGRSLWRIVKVAQNSGHLIDSVQFFEAKDVVDSPREKLLLICTGCQGEPMSATSKLAYNKHHSFKMQRGDTMILSSKIIPGNETRTHNMLNAFIEMGVEVVTEKTENIHASGHPMKAELKEMYSLIKPKISIPVHGEYIHTHAHVKFAKECGVEKAIMIAPGDIINLENGEKVDSIDVDYFGIDGILLRYPESNVIKMRKRMRDAGAIVVTAVVNKKNKLLAKPKVFTPGIFEATEDAAIIQRIIKAVESAFSLQSTKKIRSKIESSIFSILKEYLLKRPIIKVQIEQI